MDNASWDVSFGPFDPINAGFGYAIRVKRNGRTVLNTHAHPVTGKDLDYAGCLEVAAMYGPAAPRRRP